MPIDILLLDSSYIAVWSGAFAVACVVVAGLLVFAIRRAQLLGWSLVASPTAPGDLVHRIAVVASLVVVGTAGFLGWISTRPLVVADLEQTVKLGLAAFVGCLIGALVGAAVGRSGARTLYLNTR